MQEIKRIAYKLYQRWKNYWIVATMANFFYTKILLSFNKDKYRLEYVDIRRSNAPKIAFVCDEMTWQDFKDECNAFFITHYNWLEILKKHKPDIFFCESAWSGIEFYKNCWRGQIYRNDKIRYENRRTLMNILEYCRQAKIPTVFWNKEDPTYFNNKNYNFVDTAMKFDHIFTTAQECVKGYEEQGHPSVHTLLFGFSSELFFPGTSQAKENKAVFAGSWYADQPERCRDMEALFDMVLYKGIYLEIYDRHSGSANPLHRFPDKYKSYLKKSIPFSELGEVFRQARYAINVNTVKNSNTMFARRVFEVMACGCIVISNDSIGLKEMFPQRIWFLNEKFDCSQEDKIREQNLQDVFCNHTCEQRMKRIINICR